MPEKKQWTKPEVEAVELQSEDDALAICWGASANGMSPTCRVHACAR